MAKINCTIEFELEDEDVFTMMDELGVTSLGELQDVLELGIRGCLEAASAAEPQSVKVGVGVILSPSQYSYLS